MFCAVFGVFTDLELYGRKRKKSRNVDLCRIPFTYQSQRASKSFFLSFFWFSPMCSLRASNHDETSFLFLTLELAPDMKLALVALKLNGDNFHSSFCFLTFSDDWCSSIMAFSGQIRLIFFLSCCLQVFFKWFCLLTTEAMKHRSSLKSYRIVSCHHHHMLYMDTNPTSEKTDFKTREEKAVKSDENCGKG